LYTTFSDDEHMLFEICRRHQELTNFIESYTPTNALLYTIKY